MAHEVTRGIHEYMYGICAKEVDVLLYRCATHTQTHTQRLIDLNYGFVM